MQERNLDRWRRGSVNWCLDIVRQENSIRTGRQDNPMHCVRKRWMSGKEWLPEGNLKNHKWNWSSHGKHKRDVHNRSAWRTDIDKNALPFGEDKSRILQADPLALGTGLMWKQCNVGKKKGNKWTLCDLWKSRVNIRPDCLWVIAETPKTVWDFKIDYRSFYKRLSIEYKWRTKNKIKIVEISQTTLLRVSSANGE